MAPLFPLIVLYYYAQKYYRSTSRELKRLDSVSRSPLYAHFGETLNGITTIRAYREEGRFVSVNRKFVAANNQPYFLQISIQRWLAIRLETIGNLIVAASSLTCVAFPKLVSADEAGLAIGYALSVTGILNWCVRQMAEVEIQMNSVERMSHYMKNLESEAPAQIEGNRPNPEWPKDGALKFDNVVLKYRPELPPVLHGISFEVQAREKIGIVGRTGAGKSSIMIALFRIAECTSGSIKIDGVDISKIGLMDLRSRLSIIPQDPVLYSGTFRSNLDPFSEYQDSDLWEVR